MSKKIKKILTEKTGMIVGTILVIAVFMGTILLAVGVSQKSLTTQTKEPDALTAEVSSEVFDVISARRLTEVLPSGGVLAVVMQQSADDLMAEQTKVLAATASMNENMTDSSGFNYANFAMAQVDNYVNVRSEASTEASVVGKMYDGSIAEILGSGGEADDWYHISSGSVEGYIKKEYFITGADAAAAAEGYLKSYAYVIADKLNVRESADVSASRIGSASRNDILEVLEDLGDWVKVQYTSTKEGYVSREYVELSIEHTYAVSLEEEAAARAEEERKQAEAAAANTGATADVSEGNVSSAGSDSYTLPDVTYTTNEELRQSIVDYAMQYLGNSYIHGGSSLESGTDCSGFTCYIYAAFGYSISRTPSGQYSSAGTSISVSDIQPGDIICYGSSAKSVTHVALYIGDGQIIHSANPRKGVVTQNYDYDNIVGIKNVVG